MSESKTNGGWILIHRKVRNSVIWERKASKFQAWVDLIMYANFEENEQFGYTVKRGQLLVSLRFLANRWKWSTKKVCNFMHILQEVKAIKVNKVGNSKGNTPETMITICNYDIYQTGLNEKGNSKGNKYKEDINKYNNDTKKKDFILRELNIIGEW